MGDPLDDALGELSTDQANSHRWQGEETWHRFLARKKVIEATASFLNRMGAKGNPGTEKLKQGKFHKESVWNIRWIIRESRGGFLLTRDGRLSSSGYGANNSWALFRNAEFFGLGASEARAIEQQGPPDLSISQGMDLKYMPEADAIVRGMASLVKQYVG